MADYRSSAFEALRRYWPRGGDQVRDLPIASAPSETSLPVRLKAVRLPEWAEACGIEGALLVPAEAPGDGWADVDWWWVAHWYLNNLAEREHERRSGPIHSYSLRLSGWDGRMWERAWVNRIALFLRRWAATRHGTDEASLFGPLPAPEIVVTHDLDAVEKTASIRFKQSAFHAFNAARRLARGRIGDAGTSVARSVRFFLRGEDYRHFGDLVPTREERRVVNVYGGGMRRPRSWKDHLFDPSYRIDRPDLVTSLRGLTGRKVEIGLHPSFASWNDGERMAEEKAWAEEALGLRITACRQHWLRFSFADTWRLQAACGLERDSTLGFNDRPGFRNGAALAFRPEAAAGALESWPLVVMDSHLYDYLDLDAAGRAEAIAGWIGEIRQVGGQATLLWHPHTLGRDYGWRDGFERVIETLGGIAA
jgi:hypothetical protein